MYSGGNSITWECRFPRAYNPTGLFLLLCVTAIIMIIILLLSVSTQKQNRQNGRKQHFDIRFKVTLNVGSYIIVQWDYLAVWEIVCFLRKIGLFKIGSLALFCLLIKTTKLYMYIAILDSYFLKIILINLPDNFLIKINYSRSNMKLYVLIYIIQKMTLSYNNKTLCRREKI